MRITKSSIFFEPILALAELIKCKCCDASIVQISPKGGYYGCLNAKRENCHNKQRISRNQVKAIILNDLKEKFLTVENLKFSQLMEVSELKSIPKKCHKGHEQLIKIPSYYVANTSIQTVALLFE